MGMIIPVCMDYPQQNDDCSQAERNYPYKTFMNDPFAIGTAMDYIKPFQNNYYCEGYQAKKSGYFKSPGEEEKKCA